MTPTETLKDDIAYLKSMAADGHRANSAGGSMLVLSGGLWGATALMEWGRLMGWIDFPVSYVWLASMALFFVIGAPIILRLRRLPGARSLGNLVVGYAWAAVGWAIFALVSSAFAIAWRAQSAEHMLMLAPAIMALYGVGWAVDSVASGKRWRMVVSVASSVSAVIVALLSTDPALYMLSYAIALFGLGAAPGLVMMYEARAERA